MKILLTGKCGQIGAELATHLALVGEVVATDRRQLNLADPEDIRRVIRNSRPNVIVNAAAYTDVDGAETDEANARLINADAPALMAEEAKRIGAFLVHYSTDYVFDGCQHVPYTESDVPNPVNVYGRTKLAGEGGVREVGVPHLILRTAWVYGTRGRNFLKTILRLGTQCEELKIVHDQVGAPTWCREIAKATTRILDHSGGRDPGWLAQYSGTYHLTAAGQTSWFEFANAILEQASRTPKNLHWLAAATNGLPSIVRRITPVASAQYPTAARRPAYSVLSNSRLKQVFGFGLPDWRVQLHLAFADGPVNAPADPC